MSGAEDSGIGKEGEVVVWRSFFFEGKNKPKLRSGAFRMAVNGMDYHPFSYVKVRIKTIEFNQLIRKLVLDVRFCFLFQKVYSISHIILLFWYFIGK